MCQIHFYMYYFSCLTHKVLLNVWRIKFNLRKKHVVLVKSNIYVFFDIVFTKTPVEWTQDIGQCHWVEIKMSTELPHFSKHACCHMLMLSCWASVPSAFVTKVMLIWGCNSRIFQVKKIILSSVNFVNKLHKYKSIAVSSHRRMFLIKVIF